MDGSAPRESGGLVPALACAGDRPLGGGAGSPVGGGGEDQLASWPVGAGLPTGSAHAPGWPGDRDCVAGAQAADPTLPATKADRSVT